MHCADLTNPNLEEVARGRVIVAMSGGVDSSVVAAKLQQEGMDVVGISMRLYSTPHKTPGKSCCSPDDLIDARSSRPHSVFLFTWRTTKWNSNSITSISSPKNTAKSAHQAHVWSLTIN